MILRKLMLVSLVVIMTSELNGQAISSPYTINGVGDIAFDGFGNNSAMGEVGIGSPTLWHINIQNPAQLVYNTFSSFQVGIIGDFRTYNSNTDDDTQNSASLRYMAMSFPIMKGRWTSAFSLTPLSTVQYNTFSRDSLDSATRITQSQGEGGLTQLSWANGFRILKSLSVGIKASYVFGEITRSTRDLLTGPDVSSAYSVSYVETYNYSDFLFSTGMSYRQGLGKQNFLNIGATYILSNTLDGSHNSFFQRLSLAGSPVQQIVIADGEKVSFELPQSYGLGLSYEKLNRLQVGLDIKFNQRKSAASESGTTRFRDTYTMGLGVGWTPDYQSVNNYLQRATYRLGFNMKQLPYLINNTEINDFGINFGASFPVSGYSSMDVALKYGFRGTTQNSLIMENYIQVILGATINDNQWFIKRRYD